MKWETLRSRRRREGPKEGDTFQLTRFALLPCVVGDHWIWLELYFAKFEYKTRYVEGPMGAMPYGYCWYETKRWQGVA